MIVGISTSCSASCVARKTAALENQLGNGREPVEKLEHVLQLSPSAAQERRESAPWPGSRRSRRCAPWCAAGLVPAAGALREPRAASPRCLRQTTRRSPLPRLLWSSVSVELGAQPPRPCPSSVPVGRRALLQPPPCRSCGGRLRRGPLRRSAAHVATMSAGVAVFAARRRRVRHAATCRPLGLSRTVTQKKRAHLLSLLLLLLFWRRHSDACVCPHLLSINWHNNDRELGLNSARRSPKKWRGTPKKAPS